jgi:hypothetical protein
LSVYPTNFHAKPSSRLWIPRDIHPIPADATILGAYATPKANTLIPLFNLLF